MPKRARDQTVYVKVPKPKKTKFAMQYKNQGMIRNYVPRTPGGQIIAEKKYFDSLLSAGAIATSTDWTATEMDPATANTLFSPAPGTAINQRVGRKVNVHKMRIRGNINVPAQTTQSQADNAAVIRLIVHQDQQTNGAQAQGEQVMEAPATATSLLCTQTFMSLANLGRFKILKDKIYSLNKLPVANDTGATGGITQGGMTIPFKINLKFNKPITVHYNATGGSTVADIVDNSFHIIATTSNNNYSSTLSYTCRTVFSDA